MSFLQKYEEDIEKIKSFIQEFMTELNKSISELNERYDPIDWIKRNPRYVITAIIILAIIAFFPLMSVWILACIGTGYPGYKIIQSMLADKQNLAQSNKKNEEIKEFIHTAISEQKIIQIPIRHNSRINLRRVMIRGEMEDGLSVTDPQTGIHTKYLWDSIDLDAFYMTYIKSGHEAPSAEE